MEKKSHVTQQLNSLILNLLWERMQPFSPVPSTWTAYKKNNKQLALFLFHLFCFSCLSACFYFIYLFIYKRY